MILAGCTEQTTLVLHQNRATINSGFSTWLNKKKGGGLGRRPGEVDLFSNQGKITDFLSSMDHID